MNYRFEFNPSDLPAIAAILLATVIFCSYWFLFVSPAYKKFCIKKYPGDEGKIFHILSLKYYGVIMLGIVPVIFFMLLFPEYNLASFGIILNTETIDDSLLWIICIGLPVILITRIGSKRPHAFDVYPQIRIPVWDNRLLTRYSIAWAFYMFSYEVLFRGLLLFPLVNKFGVFPAIAINTLFYVASHIPKGAAETYSALFFGPVLCIITLQTGMIWAAGFIHVILAVSNCFVSVKHNPAIRIVKSRLSVDRSITDQSATVLFNLK